MRTQCTKITKKAKKKFEQSIIKNVKTDPKGFWGYVRDKTKSKTMVADLKDLNGNLISDQASKYLKIGTCPASQNLLAYMGKI